MTSIATGGKFVNGAFTAAFERAFNAESQIKGGMNAKAFWNKLFGWMATPEEAAVNRQKTEVSVQLGAGGQYAMGIPGATQEFGVAFDTHLNACFYETTCATFGLQAG